MAGQTTYEVYVLQGTRWEIQSRYNAVQKDAAIQEAKSLEVTPNIDATKVVKEIYNAKDGVSEEYTIYKSEALKKKAPSVREVFAAAPNAAVRAVRPAADTPRPPAKSKQPVARRKPVPKRRRQRKSSIVTVVVKVLLVMLFSMTVAALFTAVGAMNLPYTDIFGISMAGNSRTNVLFIVFVLTFVLSALLTAKSVLKKSDFNRSPRTVEAPVPSARAVPVPVAPEQLAVPAPIDEAIDPPPEVDEPKEPETEAAPEKEPAESTGASALSAEAEQQKLYMMKFLGDSLGHVQGGAQKMDNFHKFGVNLYLAGAVEALAKQKSLGDDDEARILSDGV